jgi:haloalkane dehalogenase
VLRPVRRSPGRSKNARPVLLLWADSDPMLPLETLGRQAQDLFLAAGKLTVIEDAGHFLQEDQGEHFGTLIADWLAT